MAREGFNAIEERSFTVEEAYAAREAFVTSASGGVIPVVSVDGQIVGNGSPGPVTMRIHALYSEFAHAAAHASRRTASA
jgi:D-alanine transaminase